MQYTSIVGHTIVLSQIKKLIRENSFKGAYLFDGPIGVGKETIATITAKYINCTGTKDDSCRCENCRLFPNIPDFFKVSNDDDSKIVIKDIENIASFLELYPYRSNQRVLLINNIDSISYASACSLLKLLEDIKEYNVVIMVSNKIHKVLPTIVSRSIPVHFMSLLPEDYISILKKQGFNSEKFNSIKRMIPYISENILKNYTIYVNYINSIPKFLLNFSNITEDELLSIIKEIDEKKELLYFSEILIMYLNDILKSYYEAQESFCNEKEYELIYKLKDIWTEKLCYIFIDRLKNTIIEYNRGLNINIKPRILVDILYTKNIFNNK